MTNLILPGRRRPVDAPYCAFFDVDGTLINTRSLISFMPSLAMLPEVGPTRSRSNWDTLAERVRSRMPREALNRGYYEIYEGLDVERIAKLGRIWFAQARRHADFFNDEGMAALRQHQGAGAVVGFVSGSFRELLAPLADLLEVDFMLCAPMEVEAGRFTGRLTGDACIGAGKAVAIRQFAATHDVDLAKAHAYGDDVTDQPMLDAVGHPTMLVPSKAYASEWERLFPAPSTT
jgi:HAD superfamily hydrolase (TIGR01490 family)